VTIPATSYVASLVTPSMGIQFIDPKTGNLTQNGVQTLQALVGFVNVMNRIIPCNATGTNVITLTMLVTSPQVQQYNDFDTFRAVAANTTTGLVTALVATPSGNLGTINVYKNNGAAQATTGDITAGLLYDFTFCDSLNSGAGGLVLR
jgi:hypothetical protein